MESQREAFLRRDGELLEQLIVECVKVKAEVVSADEREGGERRILNFGHTIGHALESATKYRHFLHGEAVGWGMVAAAAIGREMNITEPASRAHHVTGARLWTSAGSRGCGRQARLEVAPVRQENDRRRAALHPGEVDGQGGSGQYCRSSVRVLRAVDEIARLSQA